MRRFASLTCILLATLTACTPARATPSPFPTSTEIPLTAILPSALPVESPTSSSTPEIIYPTLEPSPTLDATFTLEPTLTQTLPPLPTLNFPPTQAATSLPQPEVGSGAIQFYGPGPLSKLISPVIVYGYAIPGYGNIGRAYLYGEDGRQLAYQALQLNTFYTWAYFWGKLPFEVLGAGELARLTMSTQDEYGRTTAVYSEHLILLPEGYSIITPPGDFKERCVIDQPVPGQYIAGGMLSVAGGMRPFNNLPLAVELVTRDRITIASQRVPITPASDDSYVHFHVDLPYFISTGTWALLKVSQQDDRIEGMMYLYSREIYLNP